MENFLTRTISLLGKDSVDILQNSRVAVFGLGGVGSYCAEALVRCGVGSIDLIDSDTINVTNINRQIIALNSTLGLAKTEVLAGRLKDINPKLNVKIYQTFFSKENSEEFDFTQYDYVIDAIDTVSSKIELIIKSKEVDCPIISSMGTGNKIYPEKFEIADVYKTSVCPLARVMRTELKKRGVKNLKVLYSKENPIKNSEQIGKIVPSSISFTPPVAGMIIAGEVVRSLISWNK